MKKFGTLLLIAFLLAGGYLLWWQRGAAAVDPHSTKHVIFIVQRGEGLRAIASDLKNENLINDPVIFFLLVKQLGLDTKIQAGDFRLSPAMNATDIAKSLTKGNLDIWVTIPEGKRADEIADILKNKIPSYSETWRAALEEKEGYLFPDTYLIPRQATIESIITLLTDTFDKRFATIKNSKTTNLSDTQTVIVASIIEREAVFDEDRPIVASVIMNRLNDGMALQVDPSVSYALGYQTGTKSWWKQELTYNDLAVNSPYNTYKHVGLPPTPISNPGLSALQAALTPAKTNYLYYYSDKQGHLHFATSLEGHHANIEKYGN